MYISISNFSIHADVDCPNSRSKDCSLPRIRRRQAPRMPESCLTNGKMKPQLVKNSMNAYLTKKSGVHSLTTQMHGRIMDVRAARAERHTSMRVADTM